MKVLITGCRGQLGTALQKAYEDQTLLLTDFEALDITDSKAVREYALRERPDLIINAAAYTQVDKAEQEPGLAYAINAKGPENLARTAAELNVPIVHISTDYVFDGSLGRPYHEDDSPNPVSVYGKTKLEGELAVAAAAPKHFIVRTAWLYSLTGQNFPKTMIGLSRKNSEVRVVNDQTGSPTYAPHLSRALKKLVETKSYGLRHLAGSGAATWFELTRELYLEMGITAKVMPVTTDQFPRPAKRPAYSPLVTCRQPVIELPSWREGLREFCAAFLSESKSL